MPFTPGPWTIRQDDGSELEVHGNLFVSHDNEDVAMVISIDVDDNGQEQCDAWLIAAGPDLLAACKRVMQLAISAGPDEIFREVRAAIAKAEGRG